MMLLIYQFIYQFIFFSYVLKKNFSTRLPWTIVQFIKKLKFYVSHSRYILIMQYSAIKYNRYLYPAFLSVSPCSRSTPALCPEFSFVIHSNYSLYIFNFSDQFVILIISPNRSLLQYIDEELLLRYWQVTPFPCTLHLALKSPISVYNFFLMQSN